MNTTNENAPALGAGKGWRAAVAFALASLLLAGGALFAEDKAKPAAKSAPQPAPKAESKPESKPPPKSEPKPAPKPELKPESKPAPQPAGEAKAFTALSGTMASYDFFRGETVVSIASRTLRVQVMPARGGKIVSVVDRADGRELLWHKPDQRDFPDPPTGAEYGKFNCSGIDECLPTIAACAWRGKKLTDHGEVWTEETRATVIDDGVLTELHCPISPLRFQRTLHVTDNTIRCDYKLTNTGKEPWEYTWAFHDLLAVEEGDRIVLPGEVKELLADKKRAVAPSKADEPYARINWPVGQTGFNYATLQTGKPGVKSSLKAYTPKLKEGWCALHNPKSGRLWALLFDPKDTPYVGVWINNGDWGGYHHVALEPCNGGPDPLDVAVKEWKWFTTLKPGETKSWWLKILVHNNVKDFKGLTADGKLK